MTNDAIKSELIRRIADKLDAIYSADDFNESNDDFERMTDLLDILPLHSPERIQLALRYEICPIHLCDAQICADDDIADCADERG